jgi:hypothetical protein
VVSFALEPSVFLLISYPVDYTGRAIREDKKGFIVKSLPPILERLGINEQQWLSNVKSFEAFYYQRFAQHRPEKASAKAHH